MNISSGLYRMFVISAKTVWLNVLSAFVSLKKSHSFFLTYQYALHDSQSVLCRKVHDSFIQIKLPSSPFWLSGTHWGSFSFFFLDCIILTSYFPPFINIHPTCLGAQSQHEGRKRNTFILILIRCLLCTTKTGGNLQAYTNTMCLT